MIMNLIEPTYQKIVLTKVHPTFWVPLRPDHLKDQIPIGVTTCYVTYIDKENGLIHLAFIDSDDLTPVLDIKPYHPSSDTVIDPNMPEWAKAFPKSLEESADFDWSKVFNFYNR